MSLLWEQSTLRRLRARHRRDHPGVVLRARLVRTLRAAKECGRTAFAGVILLCLPMIWLAGGVYAGSMAPIQASAGLAAVFWIFAARVIYFVSKNTAVPVPPEILLLTPCGENEAIARRHARERFLKLILGALVLAFWATVCFARRGDFAWPRSLAAALLLWAQVLVLAAAMPRAAPWLQRLWQRIYPPGQTPPRMRRSLVTLFTLLFIGLTAAQFALGMVEQLRALGEALALVLPPAGFLQWAAHPQAFPYWQSAVTLLLIWPARPVLRQWRNRWCALPVIATSINHYWSANHQEEEDEDEDEYSEAAGGPSAPPADPRSTLRAHLDSDRWDSGRFLLPTVPPLTRRSFLPPRRRLVAGLVAVAAGVLSGVDFGAVLGWVLLLSASVCFGTFPRLMGLWGGQHSTLGRIAVHEWLPMPVRPMWQTVERHQHRGALSGIGGAAALCLAGGIVTALAALVPPLWLWHQPLKYPPPAIAAIALIATTGISLAIRAAAPMRFAVLLLSKDRLTLATRLAGLFPGILNLGSLLAIVIAVSYLLVPLLKAALPGAGMHLLPCLAFLAASEILRLLAARLYLWFWAHGRRL